MFLVIVPYKNISIKTGWMEYTTSSILLAWRRERMREFHRIEEFHSHETDLT
jgi:hypothetical protein